mmetsp:Transcript_25951/g.38383  ORF Transcript_25951/g.38383 Transcript_25951/m.38383 type:complete len:436 (+) Transcript_25951:111-1418(+)|eukprot:CAMPEP_0195522384 /NCGR_PEP_ID=MMETSP0794_2-20130614/20524_1 /TAXON_ID=515487 /ORGANISM="Stephanopyxis turris, Strain CCMP 815" /LENGTH=435 /DNA_ID=CAMNT_0040652135 /DNA_START=93 /DNA_END=1400 /DNA_ORIENTATION=+
MSKTKTNGENQDRDAAFVNTVSQKQSTKFVNRDYCLSRSFAASTAPTENMAAAEKAEEALPKAGNILIATSSPTETPFEPRRNSSTSTTNHIENERNGVCQLLPSTNEKQNDPTNTNSTSATSTTVNISSCTKTHREEKRRTKGTSGRWTREEHEAFLEGLKIHGREWKKVAERITTRTSAQIRSHAQKYFAKLSKEGGHVGEDINTATIPINEQEESSFLNRRNLSSSVLAKVEKITKDPSGVQQEVEHTLTKLHERYRQLQLQLDKAKQQNPESNQDSTFISQLGSTTSIYRTADCHETLGPATAALAKEQEQQPMTMDLGIACATSDMKSQPAADAKKCSSDSLSSMGPDAVNHGSTNASPFRQFWSKELIALQVLGGELPKSASRIASPSEPTVEALNENCTDSPPKRKFEDINNEQSSSTANTQKRMCLP